jgi:multicomponent Na+:H+ antiporter subunit D
MSPDLYVSAMLAGKAVSVEPAIYGFYGAWSPVMWAVLLMIVTCGVAVFSVSAPVRRPEPLGSEDVEDVCVLPENAKYEPFFSGEESHYSQVGGSDLFWGFKENWKKYFSFWHNWHSGIVNDYELYGVVFLAIALVYCMMFV